MRAFQFPLLRHRSTVRLLAIIVFLSMWTITASLIDNETSLPSPFSVLYAITHHTQQGDLFYHIGITLYRVLTAFIIAMALGTIIGILMGHFPRINTALDDLLIIALNVPALIVIILCFLWFGLNELSALLAVIINKVPLVVSIMREGARSVDKALLDVAYLYRLPLLTTLRYVYLPQIYPSFMAASRSGLSLIWKIVLVVELLGRPNGVGFQVQTYFHLFDITSILAYTCVFVAIVLAIDIFMIRPFEHRATRWRL
ncbi:MAG: ABC transporter permease [Alphaproteobacteria bacterium GM7ARS4]|nr:ABC transporter permease [Alphaproteobacteria bacterium GM7ARS4]